MGQLEKPVRNIRTAGGSPRRLLTPSPVSCITLSGSWNTKLYRRIAHEHIHRVRFQVLGHVERV